MRVDCRCSGPIGSETIAEAGCLSGLGTIAHRFYTLPATLAGLLH